MGDGRVDDGPAIARMLAALTPGERTVIRFEPGRTYYVRSALRRYVFSLHQQANLTIEGQGSEFDLDPWLRFIDLQKCRKVRIRGIRVDYRPPPFVEGTVSHRDRTRRTLTVRLDSEESARRALGGPTRQDGEQAYFGMLWYPGPHAMASSHCWIATVEPTGNPYYVMVHPTDDFTDYDAVVPETWRMSLPVPGSAHRYGPGPCFRIRDCADVTLDHVELWSAPWMGFEVSRNSGEVTFRRVHVRPKPGTNRLMSTWRDGFHVKGNRGRLVWEDCYLAGMNDDAFNISTHSSSVLEVLAPHRLLVRQKFPLLYIPWHKGDRIVAADETSRRLLGSARVAEAEEGPSPAPIGGEETAPPVILTLDKPIPGLARAAMVWNADAANPRTVLRRCRIEQSCRLQSPITLEYCHVTGLLWFYAERVEGPYPGPVTVRDCTLELGRGNPTYCLVCSGGSDGAGQAMPPRALHDFLLSGNTVAGGVLIEGVERLRVERNRFVNARDPLVVRGNSDVVWQANRGPSGESLGVPPGNGARLPPRRKR